MVGSRVVAGDAVHVGDRFQLRVTVVHRSQVTVNLPARVGLGADVMVFGSAKKSSETLDDGKIREEYAIRLACFKTGNVKLGPLEVTYSFPGKDGNVQVATVQVQPVTVKVVSVTANEPDPKIKADQGPISVYEENRTAKYVAITLIALLLGGLLGWLAYALLRRRVKKEKPGPPPRPAHEIALEKLDAILEASYLEEGQFKEFYFAVSEAIREYLGNRYGFDSLELTTTELLAQMTQVVAFEGVSMDELIVFTGDCDLVKFTKYVPDRADAEDLLRRAYGIVRSTMVVAFVATKASGVETSADPGAQDSGAHGGEEPDESSHGTHAEDGRSFEGEVGTHEDAVDSSDAKRSEETPSDGGAS